LDESGGKYFYPDERQRKLIPYRSKKELTGEIRLVEFPGADTSNAQTDSSGAAEATTEAAAATATQLSDKLEDYTFLLEGDVYQLPFAYSVLADKGWRIYSSGYYEDTKISGSSYERLTLQKDKKTIEVSIINASGNAKELKDCNIGGIEVYASNKNAPEFSIAKGIKVGDKEDKIREVKSSVKYQKMNCLIL